VGIPSTAPPSHVGLLRNGRVPFEQVERICRARFLSSFKPVFLELLSYVIDTLEVEPLFSNCVYSTGTQKHLEACVPLQGGM
jgi:hypothetical protein